MALRIGIDVGGTFTDFLVMGAGAANRIHKVLSTPDDPSIAVIDDLPSSPASAAKDYASSSAPST
jgi:N-methylhydantoinase A